MLTQIENIVDTLKSYRDGDRGIWAYTLDGDDERARREREWREQQAEHEPFLKDIPGLIFDDEDGIEGDDENGPRRDLSFFEHSSWGSSDRIAGTRSQ